MLRRSKTGSYFGPDPKEAFQTIMDRELLMDLEPSQNDGTGLGEVMLSDERGNHRDYSEFETEDEALAFIDTVADMIEASQPG